MNNKNIKCENHETRPASTLSYDQSDSAYCIAAGTVLIGISGLVATSCILHTLAMKCHFVGLAPIHKLTLSSLPYVAGVSLGIVGGISGYKICHQDKFALIEQMKANLKETHECPIGMHHFFSIIDNKQEIQVSCCINNYKDEEIIQLSDHEPNYDGDKLHACPEFVLDNGAI